jgi:hypothetical protein
MDLDTSSITVEESVELVVDRLVTDGLIPPG